MAELTFITETWLPPHSACRCVWRGRTEWYGFKPRKHLHLVGQGYVDTGNKTSEINHYIVFEVDDFRLRMGVQKERAKYDGAEYILGARDCVSFSADVARQVGLRLPLVNMTPYGFLEILAVYNKYKSKG